MSLASDRDRTRHPGARDRPHDPLGRPRDLSKPLPAALSWAVLLAFAAASAIAYVVLDLPWWLPALYAVTSILAFAAYGLDKRAARRNGQRVSEQALLTLGLVGGWPGALVAQQVFRHKTRKRTFRRAFWRTVVLNVLLVAAFLTLATLRGWDLEPAWLTDLPGQWAQLLKQI
ncbi:DUF1294 domain-containing protein [Microbacterium sp. HJ5]